ncbi:MAG: YceI family protein [Gemmatimonadota bacterium]
MTRRTARFAVALLLILPVSISAQTRAGTKSVSSKKSAAAKPVAAPPLRFNLGATGNEARYRVRELLAASTIENDAVGSTTSLTGALQIDATGKADTTISRWVVDLTTLKSDRAMRDRFLQHNALEIARFPKAELVVTSIKGLPVTLPASGTLTLTLLGNFTTHGVTKATSWDVVANVAGDHISGTATTHLKFAEYNMTQPRLPVVASVDDDIKLEYDFHLIRENSAKP